MGFNVNTVTLSANLTRDPELRSLPSGMAVCSLRLAFNERYKDGQSGEWTDRANYIDATIWGGQGEWVAGNTSKGTAIVIQGRLRWREWQDQQGNNRQAIEVVADNVFVPKSGGGGGQREQMRSEQAQYGGFQPQSDVPTDLGGGYGGDFAPAPTGGGPQPDDDIPF